MTSQNESVPPMDKHKRLFDLLPEGARPVGLAYYPFVHDQYKGDGCWMDRMDAPSEHLMRDGHAHALIEHAAMVWLISNGWGFQTGGDDEYVAYRYPRIDKLPIHVDDPFELVNVLLAAAEHAPEGEGDCGRH